MAIDASVLECLVKDGASISKIMFLARLNRHGANLHVKRLLSAGLIQMDVKSKRYPIYSSTEKGIKWLKDYKSLVDEGGYPARDGRRNGRDF